MAKRILYKTKAYHCPKCGGITDPTKKYCEYCGRELKVRTDIWHSPLRILIDSGNYVYWDEIMNVQFGPKPEQIECTMSGDSYRHYIQPRAVSESIEIVVPMTWRSAELMELDFKGLHDIRFEFIGRDREHAWECKSYIQNKTIEGFSAGEIAKCTINLTSVDRLTEFKSAIPEEVMKEMRCPNCGAPIDNRLGACNFCSGWSEVEWQ
jgi:uncharacterized OB-fold protein